MSYVGDEQLLRWFGPINKDNEYTMCLLRLKHWSPNLYLKVLNLPTNLSTHNVGHYQ